MKITTLLATLLRAAALGAVLGFSPQAAPESAPEAAPTATSAATEFQIDPVHSTSIFRVHHLKAGMFYAHFDRVTGTFTCDPEDLASSSFDVTIDVESIHTGSEAMNENLNKHLMSPDFFNAKEHGTMTFKSTGVEKVDEDTIAVTGDLTIRGTTKSITVDVDFTGHHESRRGTRAGFELKFNINRTDFGVNYMADGGMLGTDVRILVAMEGIKG